MTKKKKELQDITNLKKDNKIILKEEGIADDTLKLITERIESNLKGRIIKAEAGKPEEEQGFEVGAIMFSKEYGILGETRDARVLLDKCLGR